MIIDSHHHLWSYNQQEYDWIGPEMQVLARDFGPSDLIAVARDLGVVGTVAVQARQTLHETRSLIELARRNSYLLGVVGWAPLTSEDIAQQLEEFADSSDLKGLRHVVQDEPDDDFLLRDDFNRGVEACLNAELVYDILIFERHLPQAIQFVDRHPTGQFVLDHLAKPLVANRQIDPWRTRLSELARRDNVICKLSGVVTEDNWQTWSLDSIRPYLDAAIEAFGPSRLMFGSDWPVCLLAAEYSAWIEAMQQWAAPLSEDEKQSLFSRTAIDTYQLNVEST